MLLKKAQSLTFLLALTAVSPHAQSDEGSAAAQSPLAELANLKAEKLTLPNGLEIILHEDHSLPRVAVNLWYRVGPVNQPKGRSGFAHLFEHLMFEGSKHAGREFDKLLESAGATNINGTTSWDRTNFFETVPSEQLELALWLESDRMGFLMDAISQKRLDVQRDVVLNERRQSYENAPYGPSYLGMVNALFPPAHPFHGAAIGSVEDLKQATLSDVQNFFGSFYSPSNATLTLAGDFDPLRAKTLISRYFATLPGHAPLPRPRPPCSLVKAESCRRDFEVALPSAQTVIIREAVSLPQVALGWVTPAAYSDDDLALDLATTILADGKTSRLYRSLVIKEQLASSVSAWVDSTSTDSMLQVSALGTSTGNPEKLEVLLLQEVEAFRRDGPTDEELGRAKRKLLLSLSSDLQLLNGGGGESGRAGTLQRVNHYLGHPAHLPRWVARLGALSTDAVQWALQKHLGPQHRVLVLTLPLAGPAGESDPKRPTDVSVPSGGGT